MAWIESHQNLEDHPKVMLLMQKTGWNLDECIGRLHRLWWWALKYAEDGDLSKYDCSQFLVRLDPNKDPKELFHMLKEVSLVENNGMLHDWLDYAGRYLTAKYRTSKPNKLKDLHKKHKSANSRTKVGQKSAHLTNLTNLTNQPNLTITTQNEVLLKSFGDILGEKVKVYLDRIAKKNKSGIITEGRKQTLLNELFNARGLCKDDNVFGYALDQTIGRDSCCIGYVNAVIKNRKTKRPL